MSISPHNPEFRWTVFGWYSSPTFIYDEQVALSSSSGPAPTSWRNRLPSLIPGGRSSGWSLAYSDWRIYQYNNDDIQNIYPGGLTSVYKTDIVQNLVHHEPQCLYTYVSMGYYEDNLV